MSTYGVMQDRIQSELSRTDLSAEVRDAIQTAILAHEIHRFYFNEARATLDTSSSAEWYALPTNFQRPDIVAITVNSSKYPLTPNSHEALEYMQDGNTTGVPCEYAIYQNQLRLYPIPTAIYSMQFSYVKKLGDLSASGDTNSWMTDGESLIRTYAKAHLLLNKIRGPEAQMEAKLLFDEAAKIKKDLEIESNSRKATGRVKVSAI